jgi:hypothetical protein
MHVGSYSLPAAAFTTTSIVIVVVVVCRGCSKDTRHPSSRSAATRSERIGLGRSGYAVFVQSTPSTMCSESLPSLLSQSLSSPLSMLPRQCCSWCCLRLALRSPLPRSSYCWSFAASVSTTLLQLQGCRFRGRARLTLAPVMGCSCVTSRGEVTCHMS